MVLLTHIDKSHNYIRPGGLKKFNDSYIYLPASNQKNQSKQEEQLCAIMASRYWVVSLPVQQNSSATSLWSRLQESISRHSFDTPLYRVSSPLSPNNFTEICLIFGSPSFFSRWICSLTSPISVSVHWIRF